MTGGVQAPLRALSRRARRQRKFGILIVESAREATYPPPYPEALVRRRSVD